MVQVIKYKCCGNVFAACCEPECYTDKDWLKDLKKYVKRGDKIEMAESGTFKFKSCECLKKPQPTSQYSLFQD